MTDLRGPKPPELKDPQAHMLEQVKLWKRPHLKPLEDMIQRSGPTNVLKENVITAFDAPGVITHYWTWGQINHGDCVMSNATLWISSDGTARFYAYTKTDDSGDVWLFRRLGLLDRNGVELYGIPQFNSPRMEWEGSWYKTEVNLFFPAYIFASVAGANMTHHC
jgi:Family of unknown function (DUF6294)